MKDQSILINKKLKAYQKRFIKEYYELKEKYEKLHKVLIKYDAKTLEFKPACGIRVLRKQAKAMGTYLYCLEVRAQTEGITL